MSPTGDSGRGCWCAVGHHKLRRRVAGQRKLAGAGLPGNRQRTQPAAGADAAVGHDQGRCVGVNWQGRPVHGGVP